MKWKNRSTWNVVLSANVTHCVGRKRIKRRSTHKNRERTRAAEYNRNRENAISWSPDTKSKVHITINHNNGKGGRKTKNWPESSLLVEKYQKIGVRGCRTTIHSAADRDKFRDITRHIQWPRTVWHWRKRPYVVFSDMVYGIHLNT